MKEPHNNEIDRAFYELIEGLEISPSEQVWEGVQKDLPAPKPLRFGSWLRTLGLSCILVVLLGVWKTQPNNYTSQNSTLLAFRSARISRTVPQIVETSAKTVDKSLREQALLTFRLGDKKRVWPTTTIPTSAVVYSSKQKIRASSVAFKKTRLYSLPSPPELVEATIHDSDLIGHSAVSILSNQHPSAGRSGSSSFTPDHLKTLSPPPNRYTASMPVVVALPPLHVNQPNMRWSIGIYATTYSSQHPITDIDDYLNIPHDEKQETERLLSAGIQAQYQLSSRLSIGVGFEYQHVLHENPEHKLPAAYDATGTKYFSFTSGLGGIHINEPLIGANLMQADTLQLTNTRQRISLIQIPVVVRYQILHYKCWSIDASAGGALVIPLHDEVNLRIKTFNSPEQTLDIEKLGFVQTATSYRFGLRLNYAFTPQIHLSLEPMYLGYLTRISTYYQAVRPPLAFSLNTGLRITFK